MKPIDYRNETFEMIVGRGLVSERLAVYRAFRLHGPGTTREVARRTGMDILNLRPRATELYQLGFLELVEDLTSKARTREGVYVALSTERAERKFQGEKQKHLSYQPQLF